MQLKSSQNLTVVRIRPFMLFYVEPSPRNLLEAAQGGLTFVKSLLGAGALVTGILTGGHLAPERSCFLTRKGKTCLRINAQAKRFALLFKDKVKAPVIRFNFSKRQQVQHPAIIEPIVARLQRLNRAITFNQFQSHFIPLSRKRVLVDGVMQ